MNSLPFLLPGQEPAQGLFVFLRVQQLVGHLLAPAGGHQHEDVVGRGPQADGQFVDGRQLIPVGPGDGGVDLEGQPGLPGRGDAGQRPFIGAGHGPELVVAGRAGPVDGDGQPLDAHLLEAGGDLGG